LYIIHKKNLRRSYSIHNYIEIFSLCQAKNHYLLQKIIIYYYFFTNLWIFYYEQGICVGCHTFSV